MTISPDRLEEIQNIPDEEIDTLDIPELDDHFWANTKMVSIQSQALQLPLPERWQLVQTLLTSIQQETKNLAENQTPNSSPSLLTSSTDIPKNSWLTKLVGVIAVPETDITDQYIHYLEEKYQ